MQEIWGTADQRSKSTTTLNVRYFLRLLYNYFLERCHTTHHPRWCSTLWDELTQHYLPLDTVITSHITLLFNYVQCPRNYCDGVTLNQCLINNNNNNNNNNHSVDLSHYNICTNVHSGTWPLVSGWHTHALVPYLQTQQAFTDNTIKLATFLREHRDDFFYKKNCHPRKELCKK